MNTNTNNTTNTTGEKSMFKKMFAETKTSLLYFAIIIAMFSSLLFLPPRFEACFLLLLLAAGTMRITFYLGETQKNRIKRSLLGFVRSIYTQNDFEKFRHGLAEELYKEMKNNAYVEISTEKQELEKERAKMKAFLRKHNTAGVVFDDFEEKILVDVGLYLAECFSDDLYYHHTLQDFVKFFDQNKEGFIEDIQDEAANGCFFNYMIGGLAYYCLGKSTQKELRDLRKRLRKAFYSEKWEEIGIYDYREEQQELAGENEATFRC